MIEIARTCIKCHEAKPLNEFPERDYMQSGYDVRCSQCCEDTKKLFAEKAKPPDRKHKRHMAFDAW